MANVEENQVTYLKTKVGVLCCSQIDTLTCSCISNLRTVEKEII